MRRSRAAAFLAAGVLCIAAAGGLTAYNAADEQRASASVEKSARMLLEAIPQKPEAEQAVVPAAQPVAPALNLEGLDYVGVLEIPALELVLPVLDVCSDQMLRQAPCLYQGSVSEGMIIAGHDYQSHFKKLTALAAGDILTFTDIDGNVWEYRVACTEIIGGNDVERMESGDWDLTLFTCTYTGRERFTVRCTMQL